jgi:nucleoside phosphorylase
MVWQWLIRGWLVGAARKELYGAAEEMLRQELQRRQAGTADPDRTLPPPCDIGLIFPSAAEAVGVVDRLADPILVHGHGFEIRLGQFSGRHVAVVQTGPGSDRATKAVEALVLGHRPGIVIAAGFADALAGDLAARHVVLASHIVSDGAHGSPPVEARATDLQLAGSTELPTALADMAGAITTRTGVHVGRILSVPGKSRTTADRESLGRRFQALAAESSAGAVGQVCRRHQVPFFAVHAIRHGLKDETSPEIRHLKRQKSLAGKLGAFLGAVTQRPSSVKELWQSTEDALVAADRLAEVLHELTSLLPARGD